MKKYFLGAIWIVLSLFLAFGIINMVWNIMIPHWNQYIWLVLGVFKFFIVAMFTKNDTFVFIDTFMHEFSHLLFTYITRLKPTVFIVNPFDKEKDKPSGYVYYTYKEKSHKSVVKSARNHLVDLAPYFFSTTTFFIMIFYGLFLINTHHTIFEHQHFAFFNGAIMVAVGFTYAYHLVSSISQINPKQSDFDELGYGYSKVVILFFHLLFLFGYIWILSFPYL
ncbi:MAG: hypothetical protein U9N59_16775 [Campylobacterota bacterium]|nr:hypothetical protein [Campylobacterota bacterium]